MERRAKQKRKDGARRERQPGGGGGGGREEPSVPFPWSNLVCSPPPRRRPRFWGAPRRCLRAFPARIPGTFYCFLFCFVFRKTLSAEQFQHHTPVII